LRVAKTNLRPNGGGSATPTKPKRKKKNSLRIFPLGVAEGV